MNQAMNMNQAMKQSGLPVLNAEDIRWRVAEITTADAERWLAAVSHSRPLRHTLLHAFARDMTSGCWHVNGAPLIFDRSGRLLDGHIRLRACLAAKRSFRSLIVENIDPAAEFSIDNVRRRAVNTIFGLRNPADGNRMLSAALATIWNYYFNEANDPRRQVSTAELLYALDRRPEVRVDVLAAGACRRILSPAVAAALLHLDGRVDVAMTKRFLAEVADDTLTTPGHPAFVFRSTLMQMPPRYHRDRLGVLQLAIRAWNAARAGKSLSHLTWRDRVKASFDGLPVDDGLDLIGVSSVASSAPDMGSDLRVSLEIVTAEMAERLLANNPRNRQICWKVVDQYKRDLEEGRWLLNGQTLKLSRDGRNVSTIMIQPVCEIKL